MRSVVLVSLCVLAAACASGGTPPAGTAPAPSAEAAAPSDECGGMYALAVRNDSDIDVWFSFADAKMLKPAQEIGRVGPRDRVTLFFRSPEPPTVWATPRGGPRVFLNDRTTQQRYRIGMTLSCDRH